MQEAIEAVQKMKNGKFGLTAIKIELEANLSRDYTAYERVNECHDWLMERLGGLGLAEYRESECLYFEHDEDEFETNWHPVAPLKYAQFYNDGSVDSEITLTVAMDNPDNVLLLPKIAQVFKDFMAEVGGNDVDGAGMHMALLNSPDCVYPSPTPARQLQRFENFSRSMNLLLPALYFLGAHCSRTRDLEYRMPRVTHYNGAASWDERRRYKWSAISYSQGAVEFRLFDTCYDSLNTILDNVIVMKNCMKYWRDTFKPSGLRKITAEVMFGKDHGRSLERFYCSYSHVDLLNAGLERLKPSYLTVRQIKQNRDFKVTKLTLKTRMTEYRSDLILQYKEYEERFKWELIYKRAGYEKRVLSELMGEMGQRNIPTDQEKFMKELEKKSDEYIREEATKLIEKESWIEQNLRELLGDTGNYRLREAV